MRILLFLAALLLAQPAQAEAPAAAPAPAKPALQAANPKVQSLLAEIKQLKPADRRELLQALRTNKRPPQTPEQRTTREATQRQNFYNRSTEDKAAAVKKIQESWQRKTEIERQYDLDRTIFRLQALPLEARQQIITNLNK